ncbi:hypothetical protein ADM99_02610 [Leptolinea tardivitalis]|uniref:Uncharacterized protein n=1 Tax=Leptolinea tardivitalis TaxID=229920 RepID=A0A0N8GLQ5_9CHLR|nr:hypothetical protein ADM99_02610 [Leptolinea tardivitalis]
MCPRQISDIVPSLGACNLDKKTTRLGGFLCPRQISDTVPSLGACKLDKKNHPFRWIFVPSADFGHRPLIGGLQP